jgi:hypothetical protein
LQVREEANTLLEKERDRERDRGCVCEREKSRNLNNVFKTIVREVGSMYSLLL